jgi:hypothetical protein
MDTQVLNKSKLFEKIEIKWFSLNEMKKNKRQFRNFYQEIVENILLDVENIRKFMEKNTKKHRKTRKNYEK